MTPKITNVAATNDYELIVSYINGECRVFNAKQLLKYKIYEPLKNREFFRLAKFDSMCVYWNDEIDLDPDWLYEESVPETEPLPDEIEAIRRGRIDVANGDLYSSDEV